MDSSTREWLLAKPGAGDAAMAETVVDQGTVWWPAGLPQQETVRFVFNRALQTRPMRVTCQDYETREPLEIELVTIEQSGSREWTRFTAAIVRFVRPEQQGRSFRWQAYAET